MYIATQFENTHLTKGRTIMGKRRRRSQAGACKFMLKCNNCDADVNYTDAILRDVLAHGLCDSEIQ